MSMHNQIIIPIKDTRLTAQIRIMRHSHSINKPGSFMSLTVDIVDEKGRLIESMHNMISAWEGSIIDIDDVSVDSL